MSSECGLGEDCTDRLQCDEDYFPPRGVRYSLTNTQRLSLSSCIYSVHPMAPPPASDQDSSEHNFRAASGCGRALNTFPQRRHRCLIVVVGVDAYTFLSLCCYIMDALSPSGVDPAQTTEADNSTIDTGKDSATSSGGGRKTVQIEGGPSLGTVTTVVTAASRASRRSVKPVTPVLKRRNSGVQGEAPKVNVAMKGTVTQQLPVEVVGHRKQTGGRPESKTESEVGILGCTEQDTK